MGPGRLRPGPEDGTPTERSERPVADAGLPELWDHRYRVIRALGAGGMATVWLAEDTLQPGRMVALKRHLPALARELPLFLREFRIHRQLSHPNIPRAYELGFARDQGVLCPYFTMEVSGGVGLNALLGGAAPTAAGTRGLSRGAALEVVVGLLRALDHLHRQGFVHGDIKPANVLVSEREGHFHADLIDFGVASPRGRALGDELLTTPEYAAPEVLEGAPVDARADLYAVGLVLYELLESRRPWPGSELKALWKARAEEGPPPLSATAVSPGLAGLVTRLLAPRSVDRPGSAAEVLAELSRVTAYELEIEPLEAFVQRLLTVPLPWRGWLERLAAEVTEEPLMPGAPFAAIIDVPKGFFARRLLGPVLDEASARRAHVLPVRFTPGRAIEAPLRRALAAAREEERGQAQPRPLVLVIEDIDEADPQSLALIAAGLGATTRLVATRTRPDALPAFLARPGSDTPRDGVMVAALPVWTDEEVRGWLHRALGRIGAPWERAEAGLVEAATPAGLVERLAGLYREGRVVRAGDGYGWRERPGGEREGGAELEDLETLLAALRTPVPERTLATYLAGRAPELRELVASGAVRSRGDGTIEVGDQAARRARYESLAPSRRRALHRRLAQALEAVGAPPFRTAEEWLDSDTPLMAVPHLLAAAEARPGRAWLERSWALIERARALLKAAEEPEPTRVPVPAGRITGRRTGREQRLELWRYEALILGTEARVLLATGVVSGRTWGRDRAREGRWELAPDDAPVQGRIEALAALGEAHGHLATLRVAQDLRLALAWVRRDWIGLEAAAEAGLELGGEASEAEARLWWARATRLNAEGSPEDAWDHLEAGLAAARPGGGSLALPLIGQPAEAREAVLEARAVVAVGAHWGERAEAACRALAAGTGEDRGHGRTRAALLEAVRARNLGALDEALRRAEEAAEAMPRERVPSLDGEVELELGRVRLELGELEAALDHARFAATLAGEEHHGELAARAALLEAAARFYQGDLARAAVRAQEAVRLAGGGPGAVSTDGRATVLELALATQGYPAAAAIMREAAELGWRAQRRSEHARAARTFRLAAEAALLRRDLALALDWAGRALAEVDLAAASRLIRPRVFATAGRVWLADGQREAGARLIAAARAEVMAIAQGIADGPKRELWLKHPDQAAVLGLSAAALEGETRPPAGPRRRVVATRDLLKTADLLGPMRT